MENYIKAPKRKMDYEGLHVRLLKDASNGWGKIPKGWVMAITNQSWGISLTGAPCSCCGLRPSISRVSLDDVAIIDSPYNRKVLEWNFSRKVSTFNGQRDVTEPDTPKPYTLPPESSSKISRGLLWAEIRQLTKRVMRGEVVSKEEFFNTLEKDYGKNCI